MASAYNNKIGVYIIGIWCNFLGDSHFQTYVMNFVEIVIDQYLLITSHVSQAILVAHTT